MKYVILIYSNPTSRKIWEGFSDAQRAEGWGVYAALILIECDSLDRALEHAARVPEAAYGLVEVRPVLEVGGMEM